MGCRYQRWRSSILTSCTDESVGATDDLTDLLGDLSLTGLVGLQCQTTDQLVRIVRGGLHRTLPRGRLRGRRLQQRGEQPGADVLRQQGVEQRVRARLELVEPVHAVVRDRALLLVVALALALAGDLV